MKHFLEWIGLKQRLHESEHTPPFVSERDLWWVSFGENVGSEINGKNEHFARPGLILRKLSHGFYLVAPMTTQKHEGSWYVHLRFEKIDEYVCLNQIRTVDHRRLDSKLGQISTEDFKQVKEGFHRLYCSNKK
jgi:mRNA-degrading endonuclease toxin of MazEF toxin-antitoxin module